MENLKIIELEKRIQILEQKLNSIFFNEAKEVTMANCSIGDVHIGNESNIEIRNSSVGSIFENDIDNADGRLGELESRLEEIKSSMDEAEARLDEIED